MLHKYKTTKLWLINIYCNVRVLIFHIHNVAIIEFDWKYEIMSEDERKPLLSSNLKRDDDEIYSENGVLPRRRDSGTRQREATRSQAEESGELKRRGSLVDKKVWALGYLVILYLHCTVVHFSKFSFLIGIFIYSNDSIYDYDAMVMILMVMNMMIKTKMMWFNMNDGDVTVSVMMLVINEGDGDEDDDDEWLKIVYY